MGTIASKGKGKNKTYIARAWWTDIRGNRRSKQKSGYKTQSAAQDWIDETEKSNEGLAFPDAHKLIVTNLTTIWLNHLKDMKRSPKTIEYYEYQIKKINGYLGPILVQELQFLHIQNMFDRLKATPINIPVRKSKLTEEKRRHKSEAKPDNEKKKRLPRSETIYSVYRTLRTMLNFACKMGVLKTNPCFGIDMPKPQKHIAHVYSGEDLVKLMNLLKEMNHTLYYPIILTVPYALRRGEALGISWDAIDFDNKCIRIKHNWTTTKGHSILKSVKNEASDDVIAINDWTCQELRELQRQRLQMGQMTYGMIPNDEIVYEKDIVVSDFVCWDESDKLFRPDGMVGRLNSFQKANKLPKCTWHDLRHTYGTLMAEDGVDVVTISKAMRHSSVKITSDQYIESTLTIKQRATAAFNNIIKIPSKDNESLEQNN